MMLLLLTLYTCRVCQIMYDTEKKGIFIGLSCTTTYLLSITMLFQGFLLHTCSMEGQPTHYDHLV